MDHLVSGKNNKGLFWVLSRLGARELLYGSVDRVVPPKEAVNWIYRLFKAKWKPVDPVESAVAQIARMTGDRTRDFSEEQREGILAWLADRNAKEDLIGIVKETKEIESREQNQQFGESLPAGLILKGVDV